MHNILSRIQSGDRAMAFLLDPEKTGIEDLIDTFDHINNLRIVIQKEIGVDYFILFVGGSTMIDIDLDKWILAAKEIIKIPIVIFPGSHHQLTENADGLLFLNLISGDNSDYLIGHQRLAAAQLLKSKLEIVPTGYLLIDGGHESAVQRVSQTRCT
ncbi:geranylgeranylglyceryl/heptaprenylglyceryl phosphate synthase, partial [Nonlabens mediterrranea]|nr:geranylgeranylglyceryl/heptaprenylglyceryl phosphate synthase [Nonlabens mediterrranea]